MIIDCAHYRDGRASTKGPISLDEAPRCRVDSMVGRAELPEELAEVRQTFGLHECGRRRPDVSPAPSASVSTRTSSS